MFERVFRAVVQYDGTSYAGFQAQRGERTIQQELEQALELRTGRAVGVTGAGRTDAGVHALGQVISFTSATTIPEDRIAAAINSALPPDIRVVSALEADSDFNARFKASSRTYAYLIWNAQMPNVLMRRYTEFVPRSLDLEIMQSVGSRMTGERDFRAFAAGISPEDVTMRNLMRCRVLRRRSLIVIVLEANAFLRSMCRTIAGTLIEMGSGRMEPDRIDSLFESRDRAMAGPTAGAQGLCLMKVKYGARIDYSRHGDSR